MENTLYSPEQYNILWKTSWLTGLSSMYAFCKQQNTTGILLFHGDEPWIYGW